ncbi:hypothetical protein EVAR_27187_1 [Eumeta japonica]|uniref:Uncharacterized protein n=1 Tax=Eumeta variegata TaxID=151549 RepID=A0A4C1VYB0_EUMVA|nr:hypothetical protein EVAR_27187_1 [Eumeta japonica]
MTRHLMQTTKIQGDEAKQCFPNIKRSTPQDDHYVAAVVEYQVHRDLQYNLDHYVSLIVEASKKHSVATELTRHTVQRTYLYRSESPASDAYAQAQAQKSLLHLPRTKEERFYRAIIFVDEAEERFYRAVIFLDEVEEGFFLRRTWKSLRIKDTRSCDLETGSTERRIYPRTKASALWEITLGDKYAWEGYTGTCVEHQVGVADDRSLCAGRDGQHLQC